MQIWAQKLVIFICRGYPPDNKPLSIFSSITRFKAGGEFERTCVSIVRTPLLWFVYFYGRPMTIVPFCSKSAFPTNQHCNCLFSDWITWMQPRRLVSSTVRWSLRWQIRWQSNTACMLPKARAPRIVYHQRPKPAKSKRFFLFFLQIMRWSCFCWDLPSCFNSSLTSVTAAPAIIVQWAVLHFCCSGFVIKQRSLI